MPNDIINIRTEHFSGESIPHGVHVAVEIEHLLEFRVVIGPVGTEVEEDKLSPTQAMVRKTEV